MLLLLVLLVQVLTLGGKPGVILPDCENVLELTVEEDWAELIIASDGIWDVMAPKEMPRVRRKDRSTVKYIHP